MNQKTDIRTLDSEELKAFLKANNESAFRYNQIELWLWQKQAGSFDEMSNLSVSLREKLKDQFTIIKSKILHTQKSNDGTIKLAFELCDNAKVEGVIIPNKDRYTACVSTQVGCSLDCKFCATGYLKKVRNMFAHEIVEQVHHLNTVCENTFDSRLTNIVYMGMGEPLLNYKNVIRSIEMISKKDGLGFSQKRIVVSTSGISKMIRKLGDDEVKFNLALSLHAADNEKRSRLMSINISNPLEDVIDALKHFTIKTKRKVTFEYVALDKINDHQEDALALAKWCALLNAKVNIINYNPIDHADFKPSSEKRLNNFIQHLIQKNVNVSVRKSRGKDIDAACGQLANKLTNGN